MYRKHVVYFNRLSFIHYHVGDRGARQEQTFEFKVFRCAHCDQDYSLDEAQLMAMPSMMARCPKSPDRATLREYFTGRASILKQSQRDIDALAHLDRDAQRSHYLNTSVAPKKDIRDYADLSF